MRAKAEQRWKDADKDGDGALSREEAQASMPGLAERFEKFDSNGDGKIARDEMHNVRMKKRKQQAL
jgi:Ca2+-binding EF-hand superfamily protein